MGYKLSGKDIETIETVINKPGRPCSAEVKTEKGEIVIVQIDRKKIK